MRSSCNGSRKSWQVLENGAKFCCLAVDVQKRTFWKLEIIGWHYASDAELAEITEVVTSVAVTPLLDSSCVWELKRELSEICWFISAAQKENIRQRKASHLLTIHSPTATWDMWNSARLLPHTRWVDVALEAEIKLEHTIWCRCPCHRLSLTASSRFASLSLIQWWNEREVSQVCVGQLDSVEKPTSSI